MPRKTDLDLPDFYAITAPLEADGTQKPLLEQQACREWLARFEHLLAGGISLIQLRAKALSPDHLSELATHCQNLAANFGVRIMFNGPPEIVLALGMAGVHLTSTALAELDQRPLPEGFLVGASCHSPEELAHAAAIGCDFACLSPVRVTKGYSERDALGFDRFAAWVSKCDIPVYGLGGLGREDLGAVRNAGGQGVAGIRFMWMKQIK